MEALNLQDYRSVAVIGAGLMGHAIAAVHLLGGCRVTVHDASKTTLEMAGPRIRGALDTMVRLELVAPEMAAAALQRIAFQPELSAAVADADLVVEAIVEDANAKAALYETLAGILGPNQVVASNTSFLDVFPLMPASLHSRALIVHWYTPPYLIDLVDVVPSPETAPEVSARMVAFLRKLGKRPVLLRKFVPGYIANNVQMAIESEIFRLLDEGVAEVAEIDEAIRFGLAQRLSVLGQFRKIDFTGLRVVRDIHASGSYTPPGTPTGTRRLDDLLDAGCSGVLAGRGFYDYGAQTAEEWFAERDRRLAEVKKTIGRFEDE
jgi:3-hydroxybutyryl-CoA dehydrogenase